MDLWAAAEAVGKDTAQTLPFVCHTATMMCGFGELGTALHCNKCAKFDYSKNIHTYVLVLVFPKHLLKTI